MLGIKGGKRIEDSQVDCGSASSHSVRLSLHFMGGFINNLSITLYLGTPPEGWLKVTAHVMVHIYLGAAFTYSAVEVFACTHKQGAYNHL
jgi:hypothetical protein